MECTETQQVKVAFSATVPAQLVSINILPIALLVRLVFT